MYPVELEIKDETESIISAFYLDLLLSIGRDGQLHTSIYDKRDDLNFHITHFSVLSSNIILLIRYMTDLLRKYRGSVVHYVHN